MGQLGGKGDALVVLPGGGDGDPPEAHRLQQGLGPVQQADVVKPGRDDDHGRAVEQVGPAGPEARMMGPRHGVPPQELDAVLLCQGEDRLAHPLLGPGAVDDHGVGRQEGGQPGHVLHHRLGVGGQQQQVQLW